jgi:predicted TIM-barrel fold metal-dependent hydrolase
MKVFDFDVHLAAKKGSVAITISELIPIMDKLGIDQAVTWPHVSYTRQVSDDNRAIGEAAKKYPGRILGFGGLNPMLGKQEAMDELKRCVEEYGVRGFKLNGARDGYYNDDKELAIPLIEKIADRGLTLAFHSGANDPIHSHPYLVANVAKAFPELTIIMVHMGGAAIPGLYEDAIRVARDCPNVTLVGSEADPKAIIRAIRELGPARVCFGSDTPFVLPQVALSMFNVILEEFDERTKQLVMRENALRVLGL